MMNIKVKNFFIPKPVRMKKTNKNQNNVLLLIVLVVVLIVNHSCSRKTNFLVSTEVPAAQGEVKVSKSKHNNFEIKINILHLAEPERLKPPKSVYVVWIETENNLTKNLGQIESSSGFLSKKLKVSFKTESPFNPVKVYITAEDVPNIEYPQGEVILSTDNF